MFGHFDHRSRIYATYAKENFTFRPINTPDMRLKSAKYHYEERTELRGKESHGCAKITSIKNTLEE